MYRKFCVELAFALSRPRPPTGVGGRWNPTAKHWVRQEAQDNYLIINWISTYGMPADELIKVLSRQKHESFIRQLNLIDIGERLKELL